MKPDGWPGHLWLEGKTIVHLKNHQERPSHMPRGPARKTGEGFLNPAMAPARTRSVLLLADAIENEWLVSKDKPIRILDALCATGVRARRWRKEVPQQDRIRITANDLDLNAQKWGRESHKAHPIGDNIIWPEEKDRFSIPQDGIVEDGIRWINSDARRVMVDAPFQWIDVDHHKCGTTQLLHGEIHHLQRQSRQLLHQHLTGGMQNHSISRLTSRLAE